MTARGGLVVAVAATVALGGFFAGAAAAAPDEVRGAFLGSWTGELVVRDEPLALRLDVRPDPGAAPDGLEVLLDLPELVYADQRVTAPRLEAGGLRIELPFGLGAPVLRRDGGRLVGELEIGGTIALEPAEPFEPVRETIVFGAAEPLLAGRLVLPPGEGPFPLVLLAAGSGNPTLSNWSYTSWADPLARRGIASLAYDRRPDDALRPEGGLYDLDDQARDLAAAVDRLAADPRLDPDRVGVLGKSRGAWIGLALAAADPRIDFLVALGGAVVSVPQQDLQAVEARMRAAGEPEAAVQAALAYTRLYFHVAAHPGDWPRLERAAEEVRSALAVAEDAPDTEKAAPAEEDEEDEEATATIAADPAEPLADPAVWGPYVRLPEVPADLEWFAAHLAFDPLPLAARLRIPVFYAWGAEDRLAPPAMNRPLLRALLPPDVHARSRLPVYPGAGHSLEGPLNTDDDPEVVWTGMNPRFLEELWSWLGEIGVTATADR